MSQNKECETTSVFIILFLNSLKRPPVTNVCMYVCNNNKSNRNFLIYKLLT